VRNDSQQDIAGWAGDSRDGVVRALQDLRRRGWVRTGRQRIDVLDLYALSRRAEG
jgi:CRP-like cAMP-binding protein